MKKLFKVLSNLVQTIIILVLVVGVSFYYGMYVQSNHKSGKVMIAEMKGAILQAVEDTTDQPIIVIVPENSLYENVKIKLGFEMPKRQTVTITTRAATEVFGIEFPKKPNMVQTSFKFWDDAGTNGWRKWCDLVTPGPPAD